MTLARKRLDELFKAGAVYNIAPDGEEPFEVFIRKLGPTQQTQAARRSNAAKMKFLLEAKEEGSSYHRSILAEIEGIEREGKVRQLAMTEIAEDREKLEQELSGEDRWREDGYLQSIVDLWENEGMMEEWLKGEGNRSEESERVFNEMKKFTDEVDAKIQKRLDREIARFENLDDETIDKKILDAQIEFDAASEWLRHFRMHQIMFGVRDIETNEQIFTSISEVEDVPTELFVKLTNAVQNLNVPLSEVKS